MGVAAVELAIALVLHSMYARRPLAGLRGPAGVAAAALGLFAGWALLSGTWSHAPAHAVIESDRTVLYLLAVAALGSSAFTVGRLRLAVAAVAAAAVVLCGIGLITRVAPDFWPIADGLGKGRLSYPLTYWNTFGLLAAIGALLCLHLSSDDGVPRMARVASAAAVPALVAALVLSYSRGATAAAIVGLVAYMALGRPRALLLSLAATVPASAAAAVAAYGAERLATAGYDSPAGVDQGHGVALVVGLAVLGAGVLRALLLRLDWRLAVRPPLRRRTRHLLAAAAVLVLVGAVAGAVAAGVPRSVERDYHEFVRGKPLSSSDPDVRARLSDPSNNGRLEYWQVSLDAFRDHPLRGIGAGTFQHLWARERSIPVTVVDAHTLYGETLAELGGVGIVLLATALLALLAGVALRMRRGGDRALHACVLAVLLMWMLAAAVDWHWEMPVVTLPVLALAAAAAGGRREDPADSPGTETAEGTAARRPRGSLAARLALATAALGLAATPAAAALSQTRLNDSVRELKAGDCARAVDSASSSLQVMDFRPEPLEVTGFCRSRQGRPAEAVRAFERAIDRDPHSWELYYGLALVRAAGGLDPHAATARALELNPREVLVQRAIEALRGRSPAHWRRAAPKLKLPIR
ncbi:MAG: hypothetical protein QOE06_2459 [Thermoleophilaceae bacterium]|nr:hypothetical protein [Thermoleophilaceae bacterium]